VPWFRERWYMDRDGYAPKRPSRRCAALSKHWPVGVTVKLRAGGQQSRGEHGERDGAVWRSCTVRCREDEESGADAAARRIGPSRTRESRNEGETEKPRGRAGRPGHHEARALEGLRAEIVT